MAYKYCDKTGKWFHVKWNATKDLEHKECQSDIDYYEVTMQRAFVCHEEYDQPRVTY